MKRVVSIALAVSLLVMLIPSAYAGRIENGIVLDNYAYLHRGDQFLYWDEFTNWNNVSITMKPGERLVSPAFHAIDTNVANFFNITVISSDPEVVEGQMIPVEQSTVDGKADAFMGLSLWAKKTGTATITVDYDTIVVGAGIVDERCTPHHTKTFTVTVSEACLNVEMAFSANEIVIDWPADYLRELYDNKAKIDALTAMLDLSTMPQATDLLKTFGKETGNALLSMVGGKLAADLFHAGKRLNTINKFQQAGLQNTANQIADRTISEIAGIKGIPSHERFMYQFVQESAEAGLDLMASSETSMADVGMTVGGMLPGVGTVFDIANVFQSVFSEADDMQSFYDRVNELLSESIARSEQLSNTLLEATTQPENLTLAVRIHNGGTEAAENIELTLRSENISFASAHGNMLDSRKIQIPSLQAGEIYTLEIPVYPRVVGNQESSYGSMSKVYTGVVAGNCHYTDTSLEIKATADASADIPVYSKLTQQQMEANEAIKAAYERDTRQVMIACPVALNIQDQLGNELAVLSQDGDSYWDGQVFAVVEGDAKLLNIPLEALANYHFELEATDDGEMSINGFELAGSLNMVGYEQVHLRKGDTFELDLTQDEPVLLRRKGTDGTLVAETMTACLNEETIAEMLENTDVSVEKRSSVAQAMARSLVPELEMTSFQETLTLQNFSRLLVNFYELQQGLYTGELLHVYQQTMGQQASNASLIEAARWACLFPEDMEVADPQALTSEYINSAIDCMLMQLEWDPWGGVHLSTGEKANVENTLCVFNNLWNYGQMLSARNEYVVDFMERCLTDLHEIDLGESTYLVSDEKGENFPFKTFAGLNESVDYLEKEALVDILAVPDVREQSNSNLEALQESPYGNLFNYNALAKTQKNKNTLTAAISQSGSFTDSDGTWYVWSPVYYINNKNKIADNAIYLLIVAYHLTDAATPTADYLILSHKEEVQTFLQMMQSFREGCFSEVYEGLKTEDEGSAVVRLQNALIALEFLEDEPTGVYDSKTKQAVRRFQKEVGLEQTGEADVTTQYVLYGFLDKEALIIQNWFDK